MRRARSACGSLLPAPAEQTQCTDAGGEEQQCWWERSWSNCGIVKTEPVAATDRFTERHVELVEPRYYKQAEQIVREVRLSRSKIIENLVYEKRAVPFDLKCCNVETISKI
jgi:hypothetical protein